MRVMPRFALLGMLLLVASSLGLGLEADLSTEDRYQHWADGASPALLPSRLVEESRFGTRAASPA
jgi:hypothetical protein